MRQVTLCLVIDNNRILLGNKKVGFGKDKLNGFGGKQNPGESIKQTAVRELKEEANLVARLEDLDKVAELNFTFPFKEDGSWNQTVHVYTIRKFSGIPQESEEMTCEWYPINSIPFHKMWDADKYWLPLVIHGKAFNADFIFDRDNQTIKSYSIKFK